MAVLHKVEVIPDEEREVVDMIQTVSDDGLAWIEMPITRTIVGFRAVCSCPYVGPFREADDQGEGYSHDEAHRQAQADADEHVGRYV